MRFALGAAFLVLVALGAGLAGLEPVEIVALTAGAAVLVALVERASAREASRAAAGSSTGDDVAGIDGAPQKRVGDVEKSEAAEAEPSSEADHEAEPELAISERSARAILATGPPPMPDELPAREPEPQADPEASSDRELQPEPELEPEIGPELEPERETEPEPLFSGAPREWNLYELQRLIRTRPEDPRQDEWLALILSLREFARADASLPVEFHDLVSESFGALLVHDAMPEPAAAP